MESGAPLTADKSLRVDIVIRRVERQVHPAGRHPGPQAQVHLRGGSAGHDGSVLITMDQLPLRPERASIDTTLVRDMCCLLYTSPSPRD